MKWLKRILIALLAIIALASLSVYIWLKNSTPKYNGELSIQGLTEKVDVFFDQYGVPHIYAANKHDLYVTFGYVHAQDRLFQMEMIRRAGSGRLAEIIGRPLLKVDKMFLTLGLKEYAQESAAYFETQKGTPMYDDVKAYLQGINDFVTHGETPPEFSIIGIEKTPFSVEDLYYITGAMSFSFSQAQKTEPVIDFIARNYGDQYLSDIGLWHDPSESYIRTNRDGENFQNNIQDTVVLTSGLIKKAKATDNDPALQMALFMSEIEKVLPISPLEGSNSWVVGGQKTKNGEVIFCNDTHIGYLLPQTWYEAHLNAPEFELYGHFMSGIPFALVGRNRELSWGLTMLLNDDMDFYQEQSNPENKDEFLYEDAYYPCKTVQHTIRIKGEADTTIQVRTGRHGPVVNDAFEGLDPASPISMSWTYTQLPNRNIDALYGMNNAHEMQEFESHLDGIHAPGLSVNYGDKFGNIAWWGCASLVKRNQLVNSWTMLDGTKAENDPEGYYPFDMNPRCINPKWGYIYSANDWPQDLLHQGSDNSDTSALELWYPGYYKPQYRADRIRQLLEPKNDWTIESMKSVMTDHASKADSTLMDHWFNVIRENPAYQSNNAYAEYESLFDWDGTYEPINPSPAFFNRMLYHYLHLTMADELGESRFNMFLQTHQLQRTQVALCGHDESKWWDNIHTEAKETKSDILFKSFTTSIDEMTKEFGENPKVWNWRKVASLEIKHPLGEVSLLKPFFNLGPEEVRGGNETILQSGFKLDSTGHYKVFFGSQMRIIVDFANVDSALNITPSGQSGHIMSKHYDDQAELYRKMQFRTQWMDKNVIERFEKLSFIPGIHNN